jgi:3-oxoadipate enol-lactonase
MNSVHIGQEVERLQKARHVEVAGAAHLVPLEQPEETNRLVLSFIARLPRD